MVPHLPEWIKLGCCTKIPSEAWYQTPLVDLPTPPVGGLLLNEPQKRWLLTFAPKTFLNDTFDIDYLRDKVSFVGLCVGEIANSIWELQA